MTTDGTAASNSAPKTILITGANSGIGWCAALTLRQRGYRVFATARRTDDLERLRLAGLEPVQLDLADSASIKAAVGQVLNATGGQLTALFNNGAYGQPGALEDLSRDTMQKQFEPNFFGMHELTTLVLPAMRRQGYGRIVQNSSVLGLVALKFRGAYCATKYAVEGWSDALRLELRGTGINVILIEPGPIRSNFRATTLGLFARTVDAVKSPFKDDYQTLLNSLEGHSPAMPFTLGPEAVVTALVSALESPDPKARYYVTFPTYLFAWLKRLMPTRWLDAILARV